MRFIDERDVSRIACFLVILLRLRRRLLFLPLRDTLAILFSFSLPHIDLGSCCNTDKQLG